MLAVAMFMSVCGAVIVMPSAYVVSCTESGGSGMSEVKMLKGMTTCRFVDMWFLNVVYAMRPLM